MQPLCLGILLFCTSVKYCSTLKDVNTKFEICFNITTRQANYVKYIQPSTVLEYSSKYFSQIPDNAYAHDEYNNDKIYTRGQLVPSDDFGSATHIMGNVVPMLSNFDIGAWNGIESLIRNNYKGKIIIKGGNYKGRKTKNNIDVPEGFYYVVLNNDGKLIRNGYIDQFTKKHSEQLPPFFREHHNVDIVPILFVICVILITGITVAAVIYRKYHVPLLQHVDTSDNDSLEQELQEVNSNAVNMYEDLQYVTVD